MNKSNFELKDLKENAEYVKGLNEKQKSFIQGYIAGAKDAQPAPAAKEPEKQEEVKQMDATVVGGIFILTVAVMVGIPTMKKLEPENIWYRVYAILIWFIAVSSLILRALS